MTFVMRQTAAYFHSSSIVQRRERQQSRSASIATSEPIFLRYLRRQSTTVFAALYDANDDTVDDTLLDSRG